MEREDCQSLRHGRRLQLGQSGREDRQGGEGKLLLSGIQLCHLRAEYLHTGALQSQHTHLSSRKHFEENIKYLLEIFKLRFYNQGTVKQVLQFTEVEGDPFLATINGTFLAVGTTQGVVKIFDLSRR
jgi:hypothetical protein